MTESNAAAVDKALDALVSFLEKATEQHSSRYSLWRGGVRVGRTEELTPTMLCLRGLHLVHLPLPTQDM